jgi:hypothetical protein
MEVEMTDEQTDVIVTLGNKSQVHIQVDDGVVVHVAWRPNAYATWGPPYFETDSGDANTYTVR